MTISPKDIKLLWSNAAGRCAFPECRVKLCGERSALESRYTLGEMAHIMGEREGSNRYDATQDDAERNAYGNLILLCPNHHTMIDRRENEALYTVETLRDMKVGHETFVAGRLNEPICYNKYEVARHIYPLMRDNYNVFIEYGPHSEIARKNPNSEARSVWLHERLSTIVPNNRRILSIIESNGALFSGPEQAVVSRFALHARSYERWVRDEVNYEGVVRFPVEFDEFVKELIDASP